MCVRFYNVCSLLFLFQTLYCIVVFVILNSSKLYIYAVYFQIENISNSWHSKLLLTNFNPYFVFVTGILF